jgi:predicted RNA-binding protein YlqC (UPF0109 family)
LPLRFHIAGEDCLRSFWLMVREEFMKSASDELRELIEFISRALVDYPDHVHVKQIEGEQTTVIELKVAKEDLGKVIGKQGRTARAVRTILNGASTKLKKRTVLEIIE